MIIKKILEKIMNELKNVGGVKAAAVVSRNGLLICSNIQQKRTAETFAAMSATLLGAGETATSEVGMDIPDRIIVESKQGVMVTIGAGSKALLVVTTNSNAGLGLVLAEVEKASNEVKRILD
jgi:predicted regulator of Ras-like GTPase activity (Roadblock/LC7/MglB family)